MAIHTPRLIKLLTPLVAFAVALTVLMGLNRSSSPPDRVSAGDPDGFAGAARSTDDRIRSLQAAVAANAKNPDTYSSLGNAFLQKVRETADASFNARAQLAFEQSLNLEPANAGALTGMGTLALARHDFRAGLRYGRQALAIAPGVVRIYGVIVDALVELGRYGEAEKTLQRMVDLKPNLSSYARVSYFRELNGDLDGAVEAMRLAVSAGGDAPENFAYVQTLLGKLEFERGQLDAAERSYRIALSRYRAYAPAQAGLARVDAARGDLGRAIRRFRGVVTRLPLPEYAIALGETELAAGRRAAARDDLALVAVEQRLLSRNGVNADAELSLYEANHGSPQRGVETARRLWNQAPSVRSADALGWSLTRAGRADEGLAWAERALRLGSRDPLFLYHAGMSARAAGNPQRARRYLRRSLAENRHFSPLYAPRAERALKELG
jgi:pentatricopeptide repeat protein